MQNAQLGAYWGWVQTHPLPGEKLKRGMPTGIVNPQTLSNSVKVLSLPNHTGFLILNK